MKTSKNDFSFKKLIVWQKAIEFTSSFFELNKKLLTKSNHFRIIEQIEASTLSISSNIAEGKGRFSKKEFIHYLYISRGSLYETVSILTVFLYNKWILEKEYNQLNIKANEIAKMINSLISSVKKFN